MTEQLAELEPAAPSAAEIRAWLVTELARAIQKEPHSIDTAGPLYEIGADSLTAFKLTGALADWLQRDLPVSLVWDHGSIDAIAEALGGSPLAPALPNGVVAFQPHGNRCPLFCFPGAGGHPVTFARIAAQLAPDVPCYGLMTPGFDGASPPQRSIEKIAAPMLAAVQAIQPRGPYQFAGYSFGGLLAYEAAQQLTARGEAVSLVAIYDTFTPAELVVRPIWERLALHSWFLTTRSGRIEYLRRHLRRRREERARRSLLARPPSNEVEAQERLTFEVESANEQAGRAYEPRAYDGRLVVFRAAERAIESRFFMMDRASNGWSALTAGRAEIVRVAGGHQDLLSASHAVAMADRLRSYLI